MSGSVLRVLVDDVRVFRDGRPAHVVQTSSEALALLDTLGGRFIDELWLDHDLVGDDTVQPVIDRLTTLAAAGTPLPVGRILVHSANIREGHRITTELQAVGYPARRSFVAGMWRHAWTR
ncbi:cyclic-phosphate processing receiver domain-containing protein [Phycicoccus avicenniae]|uniref:cyclic-phosphate processing receiver domain-containing protein n=1 Tax=Phycicoccus avicenniae TaxID=2828860 RepID=UPI003D27CEC2